MIDKYTKRIFIAGVASCIVNCRVSLTANTLDKQDNESKTILNVEEFRSWFSNVSSNRILIPDTNALLNRSLSSMRFVVGSEYLQDLTICIPRLSVLEMERIANQVDNHDKERHGEQKRKVMSAAAELLYLKKIKGQFLPELDDQTFQSFSQMAGMHFTDAWIRKEIHKHIQRVTYGEDPHKVKKVTLVTSDLINALSANAEGIDVMYFSKAGDDSILPRSHTLDQMVQFIILCSILGCVNLRSFHLHKLIKLVLNLKIPLRLMI